MESKIAAHDAATAPTAIDPALLSVLTSNLKIVWSGPTTDARLKKRVVRALIHEVVADIDDERPRSFSSCIGWVALTAKCGCRSGEVGSVTAPPATSSQPFGNWC
ncbi:hypothetical protein [Bradyrhizobium sp. BRP22]|uniref:hypothetical protein n=1 Tax=Bradyrhizobium sp. BRP22 TaxID=2793821 RepID=UPI001CD3F960|nr:hypothetical protein [Bradyrhizobium sp. BRP22]